MFSSVHRQILFGNTTGNFAPTVKNLPQTGLGLSDNLGISVSRTPPSILDLTYVRDFGSAHCPAARL